MEQNLAQLVAAVLRARGNTSVKSLFWNADVGNLSVYASTHTPEKPKSFNYAPDEWLEIPDIADAVASQCDELNNA